MRNTIQLENLNSQSVDIYNLMGFQPKVVDMDYLGGLGVKPSPSEETLKGLINGSALFKERLGKGNLIPRAEAEICEIGLDSELEIHNYTGACPTLTYEINPVTGCNVGCMYCLVSDGVHENKMKAYSNYHLLVRKVLEEKMGERHYYYFSPKTEAFQEPTLQTGIAHNILREFIAHFHKYPDSKARIFIASKAGTKQLFYKHEGESILDLFIKLKDKLQFNTSVSIMPPKLREILEPFAPSIEERLNAVLLCQQYGVMSNSALVQPIIAPYLTEENMQDFFGKLKKANIINYKPEFLTACMENLSMIGQLMGYFDKEMEKTLYEYYINPENAEHRKQRGRTAPSRHLSISHLKNMMEISSRYGLTVSICYWVRRQLKISEEMIPVINSNGFQCLGYQTELFNK
ncbi:MAG: radical SAM protein [Bacillota bacterium]|nr:radical SAM protein [Bacillota bacterium]